MVYERKKEKIKTKCKGVMCKSIYGRQVREKETAVILFLFVYYLLLLPLNVCVLCVCVVPLFCVCKSRPHGAVG